MKLSHTEQTGSVWTLTSVTGYWLLSRGMSQPFAGELFPSTGSVLWRRGSSELWAANRKSSFGMEALGKDLGRTPTYP
jgi:hypothetical protein